MNEGARIGRPGNQGERVAPRAYHHKGILQRARPQGYKVPAGNECLMQGGKRGKAAREGVKEVGTTACSSG